MQERLIIALPLLIIAVICLLIAHLPTLSKREEKELEELNEEILKVFGRN